MYELSPLNFLYRKGRYFIDGRRGGEESQP